MEKKVTIDTGMTRPQVTPGRIRGGMGRYLLSPGLDTKVLVPREDVTSGSTALGNLGGAEGADGWMGLWATLSAVGWQFGLKGESE